jgi:PleD family two-component response regulator
LRPDDDPQRAFERADRALYQAKRSGRNRCAML